MILNIVLISNRYWYSVVNHESIAILVFDVVEDAWIVTGGTDKGVMKMVGDAIQNIKPDANQSKIIVLGIAVWNKIHNRKSLINAEVPHVLVNLFWILLLGLLLLLLLLLICWWWRFKGANLGLMKAAGHLTYQISPQSDSDAPKKGQ